MNIVLKDEDFKKINKLSIEEITTLSTGDKVICMEDNFNEGCAGCFIKLINNCCYINCITDERKDGKSVCFKLVDDGD